MRVVTAPDQSETTGLSLFLAGGITGCPDWQKNVVQVLAEADRAAYGGNMPLTLFNPRRDNFPIHDPGAAEAQIRWEHERLRQADAILFWFPKDTLCPIVLYELGAWSMTQKPILVGVEPGYQRTQDVIIQTQLARPTVQVVHSLEVLILKAGEWAENWVSLSMSLHSMNEFLKKTGNRGDE